MGPINVREAVAGDVKGIHKLQGAVGGAEAALSRADLADFLSDRNCGGLVAEHGHELVGCLLYRITWEDPEVTVWRLTHKGVQREWAVRERLVRKLLVLAGNFEGVHVHISARREDAEMLQLLQRMGFYAADCEEGLLWFSRRTREAPPEETPYWNGRTSFE